MNNIHNNHLEFRNARMSTWLVASVCRTVTWWSQGRRRPATRRYGRSAEGGSWTSNRRRTEHVAGGRCDGTGSRPSGCAAARPGRSLIAASTGGSRGRVWRGGLRWRTASGPIEAKYQISWEPSSSPNLVDDDAKYYWTHPSFSSMYSDKAASEP